MCAAAAAQPSTLVVSDDGATVFDARVKVVWSRCVEGMRWNGRMCAGSAQLVDHAGAIAFAAARRKSDGADWRLPRVTDLQRLAVQASGPSSGLDAQLFPQAPADWHWSGTANIDTGDVNVYNYGNITQGRTNANANRIAFLHGWAVNLSTGEARGDVTKRTKLPVRLMRAD